jgi:putative hemolysin
MILAFSWCSCPLLVLEGFFSAAEISLISANPRRLKHRAEEGHRGARMALWLSEAPGAHGGHLSGGLQSGRNFQHHPGHRLINPMVRTLGELGAILLLPPLILLLAEITPKSIGRQYPTRLAQALAPILWVATWVIYPVTLIFATLSRLVLWLTGAPKTSEIPFITREDLSLVVKKSGPEVDLEAGERRIINRILYFSLRTVKEVMVPLVRVAAIPDTATVAQALEEFRATRFSRLPVYHRRIDNLVGVLHDFDLLGRAGLRPQHCNPFVRPVQYVPEIKKVDRLLPEMQRQGIHLAVVVDEYGGAVGIVTLEDLLEEIVGEIDDEFDQAVSPFKKLGENHYIINARLEVEALNEALHLDLPPGDYETLAGFIISQVGDLPRAGEQVRWRHLRFVVRVVEARAVKEVELFVEPPQPERWAYFDCFAGISGDMTLGAMLDAGLGPGRAGTGPCAASTSPASAWRPAG